MFSESESELIKLIVIQCDTMILVYITKSEILKRSDMFVITNCSDLFD